MKYIGPILTLPIAVVLIPVGYLWGQISKAIHLGFRTAELGSMELALKEEGY